MRPSKTGLFNIGCLEQVWGIHGPGRKLRQNTQVTGEQPTATARGARHRVRGDKAAFVGAQGSNSTFSWSLPPQEGPIHRLLITTIFNFLADEPSATGKSPNVNTHSHSILTLASNFLLFSVRTISRMNLAPEAELKREGPPKSIYPRLGKEEKACVCSPL